MGQPEERKSFLEEAFEHRQRQLSDAHTTADDDAPESAPTPPVDDVAEPAVEDDVVADSMEPTAADDETEPDPVPATQPIVALSLPDRTLTDEALKKSGLIWVQTRRAPGGQAVWHVWQESSVHLESCIYLVTGGTEQPDPGLEPGVDATVVARSKDSTARLLTFEVRVEALTPADNDWDAAVAELAKTRLNLPDAAAAIAAWAAGTDHALYRLRPNGVVVERPRQYSADSHRAAPVPTTATTAGPKPKILHRRHGSGPPLSQPSPTVKERGSTPG